MVWPFNVQKGRFPSNSDCSTGAERRARAPNGPTAARGGRFGSCKSICGDRAGFARRKGALRRGPFDRFFFNFPAQNRPLLLVVSVSGAANRFLVIGGAVRVETVLGVGGPFDRLKLSNSSGTKGESTQFLDAVGRSQPQRPQRFVHFRAR